MFKSVLLWSVRTILFLALLLTLRSSYEIELMQLDTAWTVILYIWWILSLLFVFNVIIGMKFILDDFLSDKSATSSNPETATTPTETPDSYFYVVGAAASAETLSGLYMFLVALCWNVHGNAEISWMLVLLLYTLLASLVMVGELTNQTMWTVLPLLHLYISLLAGNVWGGLLSLVMIYNYLIPGVTYEDAERFRIRIKSVVPVVLGYTAVIFIMPLFLNTLHGERLVKVTDYRLHPFRFPIFSVFQNFCQNPNNPNPNQNQV